MNYCAVDQSLTGTGIASFIDKEYRYNLISTKKDKETNAPSIDYTRRILEIKDLIRNIVIEYEIKSAAIEGLSFASKGAVTFDLGGLQHVIRELFFELNIYFIVVPPKTLKKYWTGNGNANKQDMIDATKNKNIDIPILKKYKGGVMDFDDNINDACALLHFLIDLDNGKASLFEDKIEKSW